MMVAMVVQLCPLFHCNNQATGMAYLCQAESPAQSPNRTEIASRPFGALSPGTSVIRCIYPLLLRPRV